MFLTILIPCLNEEKTIEKALIVANQSGEKWFPGEYEIIVADNGSTDNSIKKIKKQNLARIINVSITGYGAALHWGILNSRGKFVFFGDADLSYDFYELKKFIPFIRRNFDLILGSRFKGKIAGGSMPFLNRFVGTPFLTSLIRIMYGVKTSDCNSGMRVVKKDFYKNLHMRNSGMEWASELLLRTALSNGSYAEVPINFYKDQRGCSPHLSRWVDGWRHLKAIILLRPNFLVIILVILSLFSIIAWKISVSLFFFFVFLSEALFLSILAVKTLLLISEGVSSRSIDLIKSFPIVFLAILFSLFGFVQLFLIPESRLEIKILISSAVIIFDMWVFLMETIKTYLINKLPEKIE